MCCWLVIINANKTIVFHQLELLFLLFAAEFMCISCTVAFIKIAKDYSGDESTPSMLVYALFFLIEKNFFHFHCWGKKSSWNRFGGVKNWMWVTFCDSRYEFLIKVRKLYNDITRVCNWIFFKYIKLIQVSKTIWITEIECQNSNFFIDRRKKGLKMPNCFFVIIKTRKLTWTIYRIKFSCSNRTHELVCREIKEKLYPIM